MTGNIPTVEVDIKAFHVDPYDALTSMRQHTPICYVPQLNATLLTRHSDIVVCEKNIEVFSSEQPGGLMTVLMGENMMRKDGTAHTTERRQSLPSLSPRAVKNIWKQQFEESADAILDELADHAASDLACDLVKEYALPVSAHALAHITGLTNMTPDQLDSCSQGMIDGIANYSGDAAIQQKCIESTKLIDSCIDEMQTAGAAEASLLNVLMKAGQPEASVRANIKLAISGGQNEPRDAIAGSVYALLAHPEQLSSVINGAVSWRQVFEEYARWMSPIGMSPRRIARAFEWNGHNFEKESRAFLMFGSGNRDETVFSSAKHFDITRDTTKAISFGAGPHFCAGAAASRVLIADVALPKLFARFPNIKLDGEVEFKGWAFRGPVSVPVRLN